MRLLRQSTQVKVPLGPLVDATDGFTLEASVAFGSTDACIIKHDASAIVDISSNTFSSHLGAGLYNVTLTASNTDTLGLLSVIAYDAANRPFRSDYMVVPANVFDSFVLGTDYLDANVHQINGNASSGFLTSTDKLRADVIQINSNAASGFLSGTTMFNADVIQISGDATAANRLEAALDGVTTGTVSTASTTTSVTTTGLGTYSNDHFNGKTMTFTSGDLRGQSTSITDFNGTTNVFTVDALTAAPANTDTFIVQ